MDSTDGGSGDLGVHRGQIYGSTEEKLFRLDPETLDRELLVNDLGGDWFGWPDLVSDGCSMFVLQDSEILQVTS